MHSAEGTANAKYTLGFLVSSFRERGGGPSIVNIRVNKFSFISYELLIHLPESSAVPGWLLT